MLSDTAYLSQWTKVLTTSSPEKCSYFVNINFSYLKVPHLIINRKQSPITNSTSVSASIALKSTSTYSDPPMELSSIT